MNCASNGTGNADIYDEDSSRENVWITVSLDEKKSGSLHSNI